MSKPKNPPETAVPPALLPDAPRVTITPDESESWTVVKREANEQDQLALDIIGPRDLSARMVCGAERAWVRFTGPSASAEACRLAAEALEYRGEVPGSDARVDLRDVERKAEVTLTGADGVATAMAYFNI